MASHYGIYHALINHNFIISTFCSEIANISLTHFNLVLQFIYKPVISFAMQIKWLVSIWNVTLASNELSRFWKGISNFVLKLNRHNKAKRRISKRQENKAPPNFQKNKHLLSPDMHTCVCVSENKKCLFFGKFGGLCFPVTAVLRLALFVLLRRNVI